MSADLSRFEVQSICAPGNNGTGFAHVGPDCASGKHTACRGEAWCFIEDAADECDCGCHVERTPDTEQGE